MPETTPIIPVYSAQMAITSIPMVFADKLAFIAKPAIAIQASAQVAPMGKHQSTECAAQREKQFKLAFAKIKPIRVVQVLRPRIP